MLDFYFFTIPITILDLKTEKNGEHFRKKSSNLIQTKKYLNRKNLKKKSEKIFFPVSSKVLVSVLFTYTDATKNTDTNPPSLN